MTRPPMLDALIHDLRYALRTLRKSPGFTLVAVLTLALGIGANAALFTIADRLLLRPPAGVQDPDRVARLSTIERSSIGGELTDWGTGYPQYAALRDDSRAFAEVAASLGPRQAMLTVNEGNARQRVKLDAVTPSFFPLLGVRPALGRFFTEDENRSPHGSSVVVLSYAFWQSQFGGDPRVLGHTVQLDSASLRGFNDAPYTVVGVAPEHFSGVDLDATDAWIPISAAVGEAFGSSYQHASWVYRAYHVLVRLRPGITPVRASAAATLDVRRAWPNQAHSTEVRVRLGSLVAARGAGSTSSRAIAITERLVGVAAIVLLIACANIANLLLARAAHRRREIAVRLALGISRRRLVGQLLTESMLLALAGGAAALLVAVWGGLLLRSLVLPRISWAGGPVDLRIVGFTAAVTLLTGVMAGLIPALQGSRADLTMSLKAGWRAQLGRPSTVRSGLLVVQAALSMVLLVGAGLFIQSLARARAIDLGVDADRLVVARVLTSSLDETVAYTASLDARLMEVAGRVGAMPGVAGVAEAATAPFFGDQGGSFTVPGRDSRPPLGVASNYVAPGYFETVGTPMVRGRAFAPSDRAGSQPVAILNETMAHALWPDESTLGKCIKFGAQSDTLPCTYVVGIAHDTHRGRLIEPPSMQYYLPIAQHPLGAGSPRSLVVRAAADPGGIVRPVRTLLANALPHGVRVIVEPFRQRIDPQLRPWKLGAMMFGAFGLLALVVAGIGLYSVVSYSVAQRMHEMGVRLAIGARPGDVARLVLVQSVRVTLVGVAVGCAVALSSGTLIASMLYDTPTYDPVVLGGVALVLVAVAVVASLIPARRATRVDPMVALRSE